MARCLLIGTVLTMLLTLVSCKKSVNIKDITADNYEEILIKTGEHSLDKYESGLSKVAGNMVMDSRAKDIVSINYPWTFTNEVTDIKYRIVTFRNQITPEEYRVVYFSPETDRVGSAIFIGLPIDKYRSDIDILLKKKGFIYRESELKTGSDILIKEVADQIFVVIDLKEFPDSFKNGQTINSPSGFMTFNIYGVK